MRRGLSWLLALPLVVAGSQLAHALGYWLAVPDSHQREQVLAQSGHSYLGHVPLAAGFGVAAILVALALHVRAGGRAAPLRAWPFALLPVLTFVVQEHLERAIHSGSFPFAASLEPTFVVGLALQLPFGLLAFLIARALLHAAGRVARLLRNTPPPRLRAALPIVVPASVMVPRPLVAASGGGVRGPPAPR